MDTKKIAAAITVVLASACASSTPSEVTTTAAEIPPMNKTKAVDAIVRAHCGHVYACDELGGTHRFQDYDSCASAVRRETLAGPACGVREIDAAKLTRCLDAIHTSGCGLPRSARFTSCRDEDLCR